MPPVLPSPLPFVRSSLNRLTCAVVFGLPAVLLPTASRAATSPLVPMAVYPSGGAAVFTAVADVNGDGYDDVFASNGNGVISLLLGKGNGAFQAPKTIVSLPSAGTYPIVTADFNGDGHADLAVLDPSTATVHVFIGKGDGTFLPAKTVVVGNYAGVMLVGDVNGDRSPDLIFNAIKSSGSGTQTGFSLLLGDGNGGFHAATFIHAVNGAAGSVIMAAGDVNGDGRLDVLTGNGAGTVEVFLGNGDGTFREQPAFDDGGAEQAIPDSQIFLADLYGNGNLDLVIGNENSPGSVTLLQGGGDGTFANGKSLSAGYYPASFAAADMNGDGKLDLLVANSLSNSVTVLLNQGSGNLTSAPENYATLRLPGGPGQTPMNGLITIGDFNGDHKPDVVVAGDMGVDVLLNLGAGVLYAPRSVELGVMTGPMYAADFNSDGHPDIAIETAYLGGAGFVDLLTGDGKGNLRYNEAILQAGDYGPFSVGSFNGNGKPGIGASVVGGSLSVAYNNGHASFTSPPDFQLDGIDVLPNYLCAGDFNGDGYADEAVLEENGAGVDIYLNTHDGSFSGPTTYYVNIAPIYIMTRDLNHDGKLDLIEVSQTGNLINVLLGNGDGTFADAVEYPVGNLPNIVTSGDFNGDGNIDLAVGDSSRISILIGCGDGTFVSGGSFPSPGPVGYLAVADLDGKGIEDLLAAAGNYLYRFPGKGDGSFGPAVALAAGPSPGWIAVADFNQDGAQDVAVSNSYSTTTVNLFLNQRGTRIALKSSAATVAAHQPVTFTATLSASVPSPDRPAGTVAFKDGAKRIGIGRLAGGKATFTTPNLSPGTHSITASYWGNASFNPHVSGPAVVKVY